MADKKKVVKLTNRELEIMRILWESEKPLTATEIFNLMDDKDISIFSVQNAIKSLFLKKVIEVTSYTQVYKTNAREYSPVMSANDYAVMQFSHYFDPSKKTPLPHLVSSLLKLENSENEWNVIEELEQTLEARKREIEKDNQAR